VRQNIAMGLELRQRSPRQQRRNLINEICAAMGLEEFADRTAETLSGGELRRTQIARAMAGDPELMILDEPTTGLDPSGIHIVFDYLDRRRAEGASALISTHETSRFSRHCTRVIALREGRLIADLPTEEFMLMAPGSDDLWSAYLKIGLNDVQ
jgi:ABC-type multidrug transport system ATPase subunit